MTWRTVALKDVCRVVGGGTPPSAVERYWGGDVVWVTPTDLGRIHSPRIATSIRKITKEGLDACGAEMLPEGAVVMSSRAPIGHLAIADTELCTNQGCKSFICGEDLNPEFLYFALWFHMPAIQELGSGATFSEVSKSQLENFRLAIPPLSDQKRIAALLNEQTTAATAIEQNVRAAQSAFRTACDRAKRRTVDEELRFSKRGTLADLLVKIEAGKSVLSLERSPKPGEKAILKVSAMSWDRFDPKEAKALPPEYVPPASHTIAKGDLLLSRANTKELVGAAVLVEEDYPDLVLSDKSLRLVSDPTKVVPAYLVAALGFPEARAFIEEKASGSSSSMRNISQELVRSIPLPIPDLATQERVVEKLSAISRERAALTDSFHAQLHAALALPGAFLRRAFAG